MGLEMKYFVLKPSGNNEHARASRAAMQAYEIHAVWPHSHYLPSKTRAAIDALTAEVPPLIE